MNNYRECRDTKVRPTCPFCGLPIARPKEPDVHRPGEMPVGSCSCGAVYAFDATGHNLGAAFSEALVFGCNMDWDLAWNLLPEEDYLEALVEHYDIESNLIVPAGSYEGRRISGALYFVRLHNDIREVTGQGVQKKLRRFMPVSPEPPVKPNAQKTFTRRDVEEWVREYRLEPLQDAAGRDNRIIRDLQRLLYTGDRVLRFKAADALGRACKVIAQRDPGAVAKLLQRLFTSVSNADYGASNWGAIDAIGAIIAGSPGMFAGYIPTLYQFLEDRELRPDVLRALGVIAEAKPELIQKSGVFFASYLRDGKPETRGYAAWLLGKLDYSGTKPGTAEVKKALEGARGDEHETGIYTGGRLEIKTVGRLAAEALEKMNQR